SDDLQAQATCVSVIDNPIEIRFPFSIRTGGIEQLDFSKEVPEPIRDFLPLSRDRFLAVTDKWIIPLQRNDSGFWNVGNPRIGVDRSARVYVSGDRVVLKDACNTFACDDERANVYTFLFGQDPIQIALDALPASMQYLGSLDDSHLVFYQSVVSDPSQ